MTNKQLSLLNVLIKQGFSFSFLNKFEKEAHKAFAMRSWPKSPRKADFEYNTWKFSTRENGDLNVVICKFNNEIVGQMGVIPFKIVIKDKVYDCVWGANFIIDEVYKNVGLGAAIDIFAMSNYPLIVGTGASEESGKYKQKLGWLHLEGPTNFFFPVKINDLVKIKSFRKGVTKLIDFAAIFANPLWTAFNHLKLSLYDSGKWEYAHLEKILQRIANRQTKSGIPYILHDRDFFKWRADPHAKKEMKFLVCNNSQSYVVYNVSGNRINILEHLFETKKDFGACLKFLLKKEKNSSIGLMKIFANTDFEIRLFKSFLFKPLKTRNNFNVYSRDKLFEGIKKVHSDIYDGDGLLS